MRKIKILPVLLAFALLIGFAMPALADGSAVYISSAEEFAEFAESCRLDSWSTGKTVYLTQDINLSEYENISVPSFGAYLKARGIQ